MRKLMKKKDITPQEKFDNTLVFFNGEFMREKDVRISPHDRGFMFADGVYEVIRSYNSKLFYAAEHVIRLRRNLKKLKIRYLQLDDIESIANRLISENEFEDCHAFVYLQITRGVFSRLHPFPTEEISPTIYITASMFDPPVEQQEQGVKVITVNDTRWTRCDIKSIALLPNILARQQAIESEAVEAIFIREGVITEGSRSNVAGVRNGILYTHPKTDFILPGITRDVVIELAEKLGISVNETPIPESEIFEFDEFFLIGTSVEVTPIISINDKFIKNGNPGPITRKLQKAFNELITSANY